VIAEASRHASADRHAYIGDPDFVADVLAVHMRAFGIDGRSPLDSASLTARLRPQAVLPACEPQQQSFPDLYAALTETCTR
jgi:gamma-glutamyltranspeptidase